LSWELTTGRDSGLRRSGRTYATPFARFRIIRGVLTWRVRQEKRKHAETTTDEQIAVLEIQKKHLLKQKRAWEQKLDAFYSRVKERDSKKDVK
jgi:hypothetical protein